MTIFVATEAPVAHARVLEVGDYGAGKTYFIGMLHEYLKKQGSRGVYLFDFDAGWNTLRAAKFDVTVDLCADPDCFPYFLNRMTELENNLEEYGAIAIDSLTTLQKRAMRFVHILQPGIKRQLGFISNQNDYGVLIDILSQIFPQLLTVSKKAEVIVTAHVREYQSPISSTIKNLPSVVGTQLPSQIGLYFNEVWRVFGELDRDNNVKHFAQTATAEHFPCKTQIPGMPFIIEMDKVIPMMIGAYGTGRTESFEKGQEGMKETEGTESRVPVGEI